MPVTDKPATVSAVGEMLKTLYIPDHLRRALNPTPEERAEDLAKRRAEWLARPPLTEEYADPPELQIDAEINGCALDITCRRVGPGKYLPDLNDIRELIEAAVENELQARRDTLQYDREMRREP
jgi:hypothetical protein